MESVAHSVQAAVAPIAICPEEVNAVAKENRDSSLNNPALFLNRELSWLKFNRRVLQQAENRKNPLLERVKFLAISGSNMDEFYMKRIGGLKQQVAAGILDRTVDGRTPQQQVDECLADIRSYMVEKERIAGEVIDDLSAAGIEILSYAQLSDEERSSVRESFYDNIFPLITPQSVDSAHPFPFISNLSLNLLVTLRYPGEQDISLARVKVPVGSGAQRFSL